MPHIKAFRNPIIPGFNPDPSCILVDDTYYLVTSSFLYTPGIPVYTSKDLVHWTQIGNVITRPSQLSLAKCTIRPGTKNCGGVWAPTIRHHEGTFYVCATCVFPDKEFSDHSRWENIIWKTSDPYAYDAWSDGVGFYFPGYDTSLFWDDDQPAGTVYIQGSTYWRVQEGISQVLINLETGQSLTGPPKEMSTYSGGATHVQERWVVLSLDRRRWHRARPLRDDCTLQRCAQGCILSNGHADIFQTLEGDWFAVALTTRDGRVNFPMGRETVLIPGAWPAGGWPSFRSPVESVMGGGTESELELLPTIHENVLAGFGSGRRGQYWPHGLLRLRNPDERCYAVEDGRLVLGPSSRGDILGGALGSPTFVGRRQTAVECTSEIELVVGADTVGGVSVYLDFQDHFDLVLSSTTTKLRCGERVVASDVDVDGGAVWVRVVAQTDAFRFFVRSGQNEWKRVGHGAARAVSAGFTGVLIGPFAESGRGEVEVRTWTYVE
ncbi:glycoside hydrolase family 43 protein [Ceratobasidium sp. AG-Ba]|nr:glycoside hydrolase family 43 protein [Ceratobasidium sp. AG-Ba]